jgi:hypothetical protein
VDEKARERRRPRAQLPRRLQPRGERQQQRARLLHLAAIERRNRLPRRMPRLAGAPHQRAQPARQLPPTATARELLCAQRARRITLGVGALRELTVEACAAGHTHRQDHLRARGSRPTGARLRCTTGTPNHLARTVTARPRTRDGPDSPRWPPGRRRRVREGASAHRPAKGRSALDTAPWFSRRAAATSSRFGEVGYFRRARGSPKYGKTLLSPNHVIAERRSPSSVSTISPYGRAIAACLSGR